MIEIDDPLVANLESWVDQLNLEYNAIEDLSLIHI